MWLQTFCFVCSTDCVLCDLWCTSLCVVVVVVVAIRQSCLSSYLTVLIILCIYSTSFVLLLAIKKLSCLKVAIFYTSRNFRTARYASVSLCSCFLLSNTFVASSFSLPCVVFVDSLELSAPLFFYVWECVAESCYSVNIDRSRPLAHNIHRSKTGKKSKSAYHGTQLNIGSTRRSRKLSSKSAFSRWKISRYGPNGGGSIRSNPLPAGSANSLYLTQWPHYTFSDVVAGLFALQ